MENPESKGSSYRMEMGTRTTWAISLAFLLVFIGGVLFIAYLFRYEPLNPPQDDGTYYVWDRWKQRVEITQSDEIVFPGKAREKAAVPAEPNKAQRESNVKLSRVEVLRRTGFSEGEILDHIFEERQKLKKSGASDKQIYDYFFSSNQPNIGVARE